MRDAIIIFAKNPVKGKVKTRLAADIGEDQALSAYRQLMAYTEKIISSLTINRYIYFSDQIEAKGIWSDKRYQKKIQCRGHLGKRMSKAMEEQLKTHQKVLLIGTDCPLLTVDIIKQALECLDRADLVIGPSEDGGYYLIGSKKPHREDVFKNIDWSTGHVLQQTIANAVKKQLSYSLLPLLYDIDTVEDWNRIGRKV